MPDLPTRFAALIITFALLFVQRSWPHARVLLVGILAPGRRTVASVPRIAGHAGDRHFTNDHRVLSRAPWSARDGARILLGHLIRAFASRGPVILGLDDTVERRWGLGQCAGDLSRSRPLVAQPFRQDERPALDQPAAAGPRSLGGMRLGGGSPEAPTRKAGWSGNRRACRS